MNITPAGFAELGKADPEFIKKFASCPKEA